MRRIAHLDMDAFYASVELLRYPQLRGKPVVIGGRSIKQPHAAADQAPAFALLSDYTGRGVVTTSTYEARALGVFSAMGLMKAARLAPNAILLPADFEAYRDYSRRFKAAVVALAPVLEDRGIDEIYLDLTAHSLDSRSLGEQLKQAVREATGLSCSIAIAPNKLLAKLGSELDKPDGLTLLTLADLPTRIWPLPVGRVNGIGPKAVQRLQTLDIHTIGALAACDAQRLRPHFGAHYTHWLLEAAHGIDERPVVTRSEPKSISRETTFERDLHAQHDRTELAVIFTRLCERVAEDLKRKNCVGRCVGIKLRYADFSTVTRDLSLSSPTADAHAIRRAARDCLQRVDLSRRIRLLGLRVSSLSTRDDATHAHQPVQTVLPFAVDE